MLHRNNEKNKHFGFKVKGFIVRCTINLYPFNYRNLALNWDIFTPQED